MIRIIAACAIVLVLLCGSASARELREFTLAEKVDASDLIFVGRVVEIERPDGIEGVSAFARVEVSEAIKGDVQGDELRFVTRGSLAEANPECCKAGCEYLFFAVRGVQVFVQQGTEIGGGLHHNEAFVSATNGRYSTYRVASGAIRGWSEGGAGLDTPLPVVRGAIEEVLAR